LTFSIYWADKKVKKAFLNLSPLVQPRIVEVVKKLSLNPRPQGSKRLVGELRGTWRIRIGDYRVLYDINDKTKKITLLDLGHRRQVYR
jgi:mRNA interferase RelE/StbE